ncbi:gastrula zinc finger protein XlCGF17.1-like [Eleutherodactylus coqui]|uniref:gastrula zinc finger protein XlCGF17.1-like n=1 Tax=Eleutherodactylus coqui TaxID=57060 RepID=UPI003462ED01
METTVHTEDKPYSCSNSGKCSKQKPTLIKHQIIHTGMKTFLCCGKCFSLKSYLTINQKIHTGNKPFTCSDCGKCFMHKSTLVTRDERTYSQELCGKVGKQSPTPPEEKLSMSGILKMFTAESSLLGHERSHSGEKAFSHPECGEYFTWKSNPFANEKLT